MILNVVFEQVTADIQVSFETDKAFRADFGEQYEMLPEDIPMYEGDHEVIPSFADQMLDVSGLLMREDIKIEQIPVSRVSNNAGGMTVIIGG